MKNTFKAVVWRMFSTKSTMSASKRQKLSELRCGRPQQYVGVAVCMASRRGGSRPMHAFAKRVEQHALCLTDRALWYKSCIFLLLRCEWARRLEMCRAAELKLSVCAG
jgi:hypothetical protein